MNEPQDVAYCPHCGNTAPQELSGSTIHLHNADGAHNYFLTQCLSCYEALLYLHIDPENGRPTVSHGHFKLANYKLVWPSPGDLPGAVPTTVKRIYQEAALIKSRAPNAFANQIRRCLEAICKDRGATKQVLAQSLKELAARGEIPQTLSEMTDVLRHLGNIGSHAGEEEIEPEYVPIIDDFVRAVIEYVYIAPQKVNEFKAKLEAARKKDQGGGSPGGG